MSESRKSGKETERTGGGESTSSTSTDNPFCPDENRPALIPDYFPPSDSTCNTTEWRTGIRRSRLEPKTSPHFLFFVSHIGFDGTGMTECGRELFGDSERLTRSVLT